VRCAEGCAANTSRTGLAQTVGQAQAAGYLINNFGQKLGRAARCGPAALHPWPGGTHGWPELRGAEPGHVRDLARIQEPIVHRDHRRAVLEDRGRVQPLPQRPCAGPAT
jgi:hypothetical protein